MNLLIYLITDDYKIPKFDERMKKAMDSFKIMNPNYDIRFYSGQDCVDYINKYYSEKELFMFNCLLPYAYKYNDIRITVRSVGP